MRFFDMIMRALKSLYCVGVACTLLLSAIPAFAGQEAKPANWILFGSLDAGTHTLFSASGFKRSLTGKLDEPGLFVMATYGTGSYSYRSQYGPLGRIQGLATQASLMIGGQWRKGRTTYGLFFGSDYDQQDLNWPDPGNHARGTHVGLRMQAEIWSNPTDKTLATLTIIGSSNGHLWTRASAGWNIWRALFAGPEAIGYVEGSYHEVRLGLHVTGIDIYGLHLRLSGGWLKPDHLKSGAYAGLSSYIRY